MPGSLMAPNASIGAAGRSLPQATNSQQPSQGPFIRYARPANRVGYQYVSPANPFGQLITNPLPQAPGYLRYLNVTTSMQGNAGTGGSAAADAPYNFYTFVMLKDAWGTPLIIGDGFRILYLITKYAGMAGLFSAATISNLPSWSAIAATGAFIFRSRLALEGVTGYGVISVGSASLLPTLQLNTNSESAVYSVNPSVAPGPVTVSVDEAFYDVDPNNPVQPPGNGSTFQASVITGNQQFSAASASRVQLPRTGGYLTVVILDVRDSTGARQDVWNALGRIQLYIDGVPRFDESFQEMEDRMFEESAGVVRDTGVNVYQFKNSLSQVQLGLLDTLETTLQTTSGSQLEVQMAPWGSGGTPPYTLSATLVQLVPAGPVQQGLNEV